MLTQNFLSTWSTKASCRLKGEGFKPKTRDIKTDIIEPGSGGAKKAVGDSLNPQNESRGNGACGNGSNTDSDFKVIDITSHQRKRASRAGKGRYSFDDYPDAPINNIEIEGIAVGDICGSCHKGKLYEGQARKLLQFSGNSPLNVERYQKSVLRCNTCGLEFMNHQSVDK